MDPNKKKKLKKILFEIFGVGFGIWPKSRKKLIVVLAAILIVISGLIIGGTVVYHSYQNLMGTEGPPVGTGDPGNIRLNRLAADPIFHTLPPGCHQDGKLQKTPARWDSFHHGWSGESVTLDFSCKYISQVTVFNYYIKVANQSKWIYSPFPETVNQIFPAYWEKLVFHDYEEDLTLRPTGNQYNIELPSPSFEIFDDAGAVLT